MLGAATDNAASWSAVVAALAIVVAAVCLLRHVPASAASAATHVVGTVAPAVAGPRRAGAGARARAARCGPASWPLRWRPPIAGGAAWWSRDARARRVARQRRHGVPRRRDALRRLAADLLTALTATALFLALAAACALRERVGSRALGRDRRRRWRRSLGGWALDRLGRSCMEADTDGPRLALAVYAGLVGVVAAPLTRRTPHPGDPRGRRGRAGHRRRRATPPTIATTAMALTIVGTAICLVAVTTRDRALLGWARRRSCSGCATVHPRGRGRAGSRALHAARRRAAHRRRRLAAAHRPRDQQLHDARQRADPRPAAQPAARPGRAGLAARRADRCRRCARPRRRASSSGSPHRSCSAP